MKEKGAIVTSNWCYSDADVWH